MGLCSNLNKRVSGVRSAEGARTEFDDACAQASTGLDGATWRAMNDVTGCGAGLPKPGDLGRFKR